MGILFYECLFFFVSIMLLWGYLKASRRYHWFDQPNELRKIHQVAKPTSAGVIFMLPVVLFFIFMPDFFSPLSNSIAMVLIVLLILGAVDDFKPIAVSIRLVVIIGSSGYFLMQLYAQHNISYFLLFMYLLGLIWWLNLYNFMDGADGMAVLHAIVTTLAYVFAYLFLETTALTPVFLMLLFLLCLLSFLIFNFPQSKMFMGDSGSLSVAFILAVFAMYGLVNGLFDQLLIVSFHMVFIVDATLTLFTRMKFKHNISQAHNLHLFQAMIHAGHSHAGVSLLYAVVTGILAVLALALQFNHVSTSIRLLIAVLEVIVLSYFWLKYHNKTNFKRFIQ